MSSTRTRILAVTGALGGCGATTLTLLLARSLAAQGERVAVVDADPAGGLGLHLGDGPGPGLVWGDLPADETAFRPAHLTRALPVWRGCRVLTGDDRGGPEDPGRLAPVLDALASEQDLVLVDLPRTWSSPPGSETLVLTGRDLRSAVAARVRAARAGGAGDATPAPLGLVVRQAGEDLCDAELATFTGCTVLGHLPEDRGVRQRAALGDDVTSGRGASRRAARLLAEHLHGRPGPAPLPGPAESPRGWVPQWVPLGTTDPRELG
ncbi:MULTISPECIES: cellulose synthase operon protein YhjQ/BcsQ [unclassified Actinomyces]|uniref:nucleotide-binding protein n=2 Tax=Actinomyces TaxID=1654 RepID=UPI0020173FB1|nr:MULTISPECIES: cellulose synthase operon protein YhjQ/BcsQ [unclassified Actinomyces]MCL3789323.1 hypothetical protein [Actinomyces sp. 187325]MCL3792053.1 hypothetical protein [Actinomyces sp. 186855]MCL3793990.1 hypothetical protein [Actinomyces sp. 217892]